MKVLFATIVCMFLLVFVGCSTEQAPTEVTQIPTDHFDKSEGIGAQVIHWEGSYWTWFWDLDDGLVAFIGFEDLAEACAGGDVDVVNVMDVINPHDQYLINQLIHGRDMGCIVYDLVPGNYPCDYLTEDPLLTGIVDMNSTDNDLYAWMEGDVDQRVNAYRTLARGALFDPDGNRVQALMYWHAVWEGWPDGESIIYDEQIKLAGY